jgi:isocitrate/isopropylmalate dehydrogenase
MMLRFSLNQEAAAQRIEAAVQKVLAQGLRTPTSTAKAPPRSAATERHGPTVWSGTVFCFNTQVP